MKETNETILKQILDLHSWRESLNGNRIGYGYDRYKPNEKFDYAEAYALWGKGYIKLYQITKEKKFLEIAKRCSEWLSNNNNVCYKNYSWGLPWKWEERPKEISYITTTTFVGELFIELYSFLG